MGPHFYHKAGQGLFEIEAVFGSAELVNIIEVYYKTRQALLQNGAGIAKQNDSLHQDLT